jgi:ABC-2 type transport system ATP-binding protein
VDSVLQFEHISKRYHSWFQRRTVDALADFSLSVEAGEIFGFLGPNGAGKTTAIHLALGFMRPSKGKGRMLGRPFGHAPTRARVGFLAENVALYHRPALKLIRFYGALNRLRDPELARHAHAVLEMMELETVWDRNVGKFSRGMLQRVGLAQALVNDPELLILDEPTSALDPLGRVAVRELLLRAKQAGKTVFLSSHLLSEIESICDRVAILHRGRLARMGRTSELLESRDKLHVTARGIPVSAFAGAAALDGLVRFIIPKSQQRPVLEKVWSLGGEVVSVYPQRQSLEQIFIELTSGGEAAK